ncbi:MAG: hypothetical protein NTW86_08905 [Candidatus Sumerlaeota bacterium]|nr:hypothetical protein [Candidatus Sumerlaeota bacterium]
MKRMSTRTTLWTMAATVFLVGSLALWAQDQPASQGQGPSGRGGQRGPAGSRPGGNFSPEQFEQRMLDGIHQQLGATDEEWKAIEPLLKDVMQKQSEARMADFGSMFGRMFGRGGDRGGAGGPGSPGAPGGRDQGQQGGQEAQRGGPGGDRGRPQSPEVDALRQTLESTTATPEEIKAKLEALRKARTAKEDALKKSRNALREVLTVKQEAQLVLMGILD